jgi:DNA-directed RNA polymerase subunit K/omega
MSAAYSGHPVSTYGRDVAAMRAKQLRRGALPRLDEAGDGEIHRPHPHKAERIAMEEVKHGLVLYDVPEPPAKTL